jgi:hypothetical protein
MTATNKRYSYLRVVAIQIDVHPAGVNLINTPHTFHSRFAYGPRPYISYDPRMQLFASHHKGETCPYTRGSLGDRRQTGPAVVFCHLIPPPSRQPWSRGEMFQPSGEATTSAYWAHNISMQSVHSMLACGGQSIDP